MQQSQQDIARFAVGVLGNVFSFFLFLAPMPTFWRIFKKKSTEEFHPYPYLATLINCIFWVWYGVPIVHPDSTLVITVNGAGLLLEIFYLSIFFIFTNRKNRVTIAGVVAVEIALFLALSAITVLCFHTHEYRSMFVGIVCIVFGTIMYGSPLTIIRRVIQTKSVEYLPVGLCIVGFLNGSCWFGYAFLKKLDPYIMIPNGLGAVLSLFQICVYLYYKMRAGGVQDEVAAKSVQLQQLNKLPPV